MNVLLVTTAKSLVKKFDALNPELEYCAIVTDDVDSAKKTLAQIGLSKNFVCPMDDLTKCIEYLWYDYILCVQDHYFDGQINRLSGLPAEKILSFATLPSEERNFQIERALRYYREHAQEFEMFATGISYTWAGLDVTQFKHRLFNFAKPSQDLYYDFQIAKFVVLCGGGHSTLRYALIGLPPYSFHYDFSKAFGLQWQLLPYVIALNDLHNFPVPIEIYKKFLSTEYLTKKTSLEPFNVNKPYGSYREKYRMTQEDIESNAFLSPWRRKYYPKTRDENIKILDDYLTLCEENNIRPIMFIVPNSEKYMATFNKQLLEEFHVLIGRALTKHPAARFFDGWKLQGFTYDDFYDHGHLNIYGAAKFSAYLNDFIEQLDNGG